MPREGPDPGRTTALAPFRAARAAFHAPLPGSPPGGLLAASLATFLVALVLLFTAGRRASAAEAGDDAGYGAPVDLAEALEEVHRERASRFLAIALGSTVGIVAAVALHAAWKRSARVSRILAPAALAVGTSRLVGIYLVYGRVTTEMVSAAATWIFLAASIAWVFRTPLVKTGRKRLAWLRVRARPVTPGPSRCALDARPVTPGLCLRAGKASRTSASSPTAVGSVEPCALDERPSRKEAGGAAAGKDRAPGGARGEAHDEARKEAREEVRKEALREAERETAEALSALERGEPDAAVEALRRSVAARPTKTAYTFLGTILGAKGGASGAAADLESAIQELDRAIELDPCYTEALDEKARILVSLGRREEAERTREQLRLARPVRRAPPRPGGPPGAALKARRGGRRRAAARVAPGSFRAVTRRGVEECPACGKAAAAGTETCECGLALTRCSGCGAEGTALTAREGELLCARCRARRAAAHVKGGGRLAEARTFQGLPPYLAAGAFTGAIVAGALLSFVYTGWREFRASRAMGSLVAELESAAGGTGGARADGDPPAGGELLRRIRQVASRHPFVADRAAMLDIAHSLYMIRRSRELGAGDADLARFAAERARHALARARALVREGDRERLPGGLESAERNARASFEALIDRRRGLAAELGGGFVSPGERAPGPRPGAEVIDRDWNKVWARPEPGTVFHLEAFARAAGPESDGVRIAGELGDGAKVAPAGLLRCTVVAPEVPGGFALRMELVPYELRLLDAPPGRHPPAAELVPTEHPTERATEPAGRPSAPVNAGRGPYRVEFDARLRLSALFDESKPCLPAGREPAPLDSLGTPALSLSKVPAELAVSGESLYASEMLPFPELPLYAPGIGESWAEDETLLWPYAVSRPESGPCVRQLARWAAPEAEGDAGVRVGLAWSLRHMTLTGDHSQRIMQGWTSGRPWWNIYDDGRRYFRTRFPPAGGFPPPARPQPQRRGEGPAGESGNGQGGEQEP